MKEIVEKLRNLEATMSDQQGPFDLFALFLREDAPGKWDLVVAADWAKQNEQESFKFIAENVQRALSRDELLKLSRIVIIDESNPALEAMRKAMQVEHGIAEIQDSNFFGLQIKHAYLITSRRTGLGASDNAINSHA